MKVQICFHDYNKSKGLLFLAICLTTCNKTQLLIAIHKKEGKIQGEHGNELKFCFLMISQHYTCVNNCFNKLQIWFLVFQTSSCVVQIVFTQRLEKQCNMNRFSMCEPMCQLCLYYSVNYLSPFALNGQEVINESFIWQDTSK